MTILTIVEDNREITKLVADDNKYLVKISNGENVGTEYTLGICYRDRLGNILPEPYMEKIEDFTEFNFIFEPDPELEKVKENKIREITEYDKSENVNCFYIGETPMWLTVEERQLLATLINANESINRETMTRWFGGLSFTFPISVWKLMLIALEVYAGDALNVTEAHKAAVKALDSKEAVLTYDIASGYPEKLYFS